MVLGDLSPLRPRVGKGTGVLWSKATGGGSSVEVVSLLKRQANLLVPVLGVSGVGVRSRLRRVVLEAQTLRRFCKLLYRGSLALTGSLPFNMAVCCRGSRSIRNPRVNKVATVVKYPKSP